MIKFNLNTNDTLYMIRTELKVNIQVQIGKLGSFRFRIGTYVYVGSAKRNIKARINRHKKLDKKVHWHFDYLRPFVDIVEIKTFPGDEGECQLFHRLMKENQGIIEIKGFGSSDCKCASHLFYIPTIH